MKPRIEDEDNGTCRDEALTIMDEAMKLSGDQQKLAQRLGKSKQELCIWDPYYCAGKVKVHLRKLGFTNVVNENMVKSTYLLAFALLYLVIIILIS